MAKQKTTSKQIDNGMFAAKAKALVVDVGGQRMAAAVKEFNSGSVGWYSNGKIVVDVDGTPVSCQVGINIIVVGSKKS